MPNRCWAPECKSNYYTDDPYFPVFKSPQDPELRKSWLNALHREHDNPPQVFYICIKHFQEQDVDLMFRFHDGVEIKYVKREKPILHKGAIPSILPGCPNYLSTKPIPASRFSHEAKDEELFSIARNLSLETLDVEGKMYRINCFSDLKEKLNSIYPDPWLVWFSQDNILNFLYPLKCVDGINIVASLIIDSTTAVRGYLYSKEIPLEIHSINDTRQIEPLLKEIANKIISSCKKPRDMITEATLLVHNAISVIESLPEDDTECDRILLPCLQFTICQLNNLCVSKHKRRYNTITQIVALKAHLISPTCYSFLQSLDCITLPHFNTIQRLYSSFWLENDYATFLQQATVNFTTLERNVVLQMDEIHVKAISLTKPEK